jgi:hypothetical protein
MIKKNWKEEQKKHEKELMQLPEYKLQVKIERLKDKMCQGYELTQKQIEFLNENNIKLINQRSV